MGVTESLLGWEVGLISLQFCTTTLVILLQQILQVKCHALDYRLD